MRTTEVFSNIKAKDLLIQIAKKRNIDVEEHKKNLGKAIADDAFATGIKKLVELMPVALLENVGVETKNEDGKKLARSVIRKQIAQKIQEETPQKFIENLDTNVQAKLLDLLVEDKPSKSKYVETIVEQIDSMGLENALSSLSLEELQLLAKAHKLKVHSATSINSYIEALLTGEDQKKQKSKEKKVDAPSKKKPDIKKGISKVDLRQHYYREELVTYCRENNLPATGHVTEIINRIVDHLEGKPVKAKATGKKRKAAGSKEKPAKKARITKSEKEKSEKSEGEKSETEKSEKTEKTEKTEKEGDKEDKSEKESETSKGKKGKSKAQ